MPQENYTQKLGLSELDVYLDLVENDNSYFQITGVPSIAGYGKHGFTITYNDPVGDLLLQQNSSILFEFVDASGETIFSELSDIPDYSGAATAYFWIKKNPLWIGQEITDGPAKLYVVGQLEGVPEEYADTYNLRSTFTFDIRKTQPNTSKIIFYDVPALEASASFTETQEEDIKPGYSRGYINVSSSFMQTHGGKVSFIELSFRETGSQTDNFSVLNEYPVDGSTSRFELEDTGSVNGLNPVSHTFKTPIPRSIRRNTPVIFKLRFLDADKTPAKYYGENKQNQDIVITSSVIEINGSPMIIEEKDNLLAGSMYTGQAVGEGFEQSGRSSAYLKTVDYTGFKSASLGIGSPGVMFFSGSVLTSSGDDYQGVGLELFGTTESFFRYRSNPSLLDIRTDAFFVGSENTQFISASNGQIEISSSNFHLEPDGDVRMAGTIEAADGKIGGFHISESRINSSNEKIILKSSGQISASSLLLASGSFVVDPDNLSRFGEDGFQSFVMVENTGVVIQTSNFNLNTARFIISSSDVGMMSLGSTPPTAFNSGTGFFVDGDGNFLVGRADGPRIQFDGFQTTISSSNFFLGSDAQFVSGSNGNIEISSSNFHLDANGNVIMAGTVSATAGEIGGFSIGKGAISSDNFFISGAATGTELFISSSGFSVDAQGVVSASDLSLQGGDVGGLSVAQGTVSVGEILKLKDSGQITGSQVLFTGGKIAAFNLSDDAFSTDTFFISASATGNDKFISTSNFNVKASGDITGSQVLFSGGTIGGFELASTQLNSTNDNLILKSSGQITGSNVLFDGGKIAAFKITEDALSSGNNFFISASATGQDLFISSSEFKVRATGEITGSEVLFTKGKIAGWTISGTTLLGNNATLDGAGSALFKSDAGPDTDNSAGTDELRNEYYIDFTPEGQGNTRNFFVKFGPNFMVDSDGILIASGAKFVGTITASAGLIGGFTTDSSSFHDQNNNLFISGSPRTGGTHHPSFMFISSSNFNIKQSGDITGSSALFDGNIDVTGTGTIASFVLNSDEIKSSNNNLRLKSNGQITASSALLNGKIKVSGTGDIAGFGLTQTAISSSNNNLILKSSGQITGSTVLFSGGTIGGFELASSQINSINDNLILKDSGQITGSSVQFTGGKIASFSLSNDALTTDSFFISSSATGQDLFISSSEFKVRATGDITGSQVLFTGGKIAGFDIDGNTLTTTNFTLDANGKRITLGAGTNIFIADADDGLQLGNSTFALAPFSVTRAGFLKATAGEIGGFGISSNSITSSNNNLLLKDSGHITGSQVLFTGGKIGGFTIDADEIKATNLLLDSTNEKITVGSANAITIQGGGTDNFIVMGSKSAFAQLSTAGVILGMDNDVPSFDMTRNATNYMRFDTSTGVDIKTDTFKLDTAKLDINSATSRIRVSGSSGEVVRLGEISDSASDLYGLKIYDGTGGTADSNTLVKLGGEGNTIGGWTITNDQIQSNNLIIHSSGRLETSDFASGVKGWRISSEGNGEAEFENVTIRGTLSTAVFEKETVNAVGGQLYVANSTVLTGSGQISASHTTMSVVNVSGFTGSYGIGGEILSLKKVTDTGFTTEYVLVQSASRDDRSSDTNFAGKLYVKRGYGHNEVGPSGSLGGTPANSQSYEPGQVVISTGRLGTGYIRLNANPNDQATPYMDIVERTGSGVYDVELKTRVGDLSGLSSATLFGNATPGFGIFTENGFFKGGINATTGSFTGVVHINTSASEIMKLGTNVSGTNDGIFVNNNNFLFTDGQFKTGNATNFILHDGSGDLQINTQNFELKGGSKLLLNTHRLVFDTSNASTATRTSGTGTFLSASGQFRVGEGGGNRIDYDGSKQIEIVTDDLNIDTAKFKLVTTGSGTGVHLALGDTPPTGIAGSNRGFYVSSSGAFLAGRADGNHVKFDGTNVAVSGEISITAGDLAGVTKNSISGSANAGLSSLEAGVSGSISAESASAAAATAAVQSNVNTLDAGVSASIAAESASAASSLNTVSSSAGAAQSAIDTMETQVVLNSNGMDLRNNSNLNLVSYGTNTKFFDGVGDDDGNMKLRLNTDGVFAFANTTESFARFYSQGVQIVSGSLEYAKFAGTTTIGNTSTEHVEITNTGLKLKDGSTVRLSMDADGMQIGSDASGITLDSDGDATFNGTITLPAGTVSGSAQLADEISGSQNATSASQAARTAAYETQVELSSAGMALKNTSGVTLANYGNNITIGQTSGTNQNVFIDSNSVDIRTGTKVTASFGATTTIGPVSDKHVKITGTAIELKTDENTTVLSASAAGLEMQGTVRATGGTIGGFAITSNAVSSSNNNIVLKSNGQTTLSGSGVDIITPQFMMGKLSTAFISGSNGNIEISSSKFHLDRDGSVDMQGTITATAGAIGGFNIGTDLDSTAGTLKLKGATGQITASDAQISGKITATSGEVGGFTIDADEIKAGDTLILDSDSASGQIKLGAATSLTAGDGIYMDGTGDFRAGKATGEGISFDGTNVNISSSAFNLGNSTNFISASNGQLKIQSSGITTLSGSGVNILTPQFFLGKKSTAFVSGSNGNIEISSSDFHLDKDGSIDMSGKITATAGTIGGFDIGLGAISSGNNFFISGAASGNDMFISSSNFNVKATGDLTGSNVLFGDKGGGNFLQFKGSTLTVQGSITADSIATPSAAATPSSSIDANGLLKTVSASIGGFEITDTELKSSNGNVVFGSSGTAFLSGSSVEMLSPKFFLGSGGQFVSGSNGNIEISSTNFNLTAEGNVTMSGNISAAGGNIAGLVIKPTQVSKGAVELLSHTGTDAGGLDLSGGGAAAADNLINTFTTGELGLVSGESAQVVSFTIIYTVENTVNVDQATSNNFSLKLQNGSGDKITIKSGFDIHNEDSDITLEISNLSVDLTGGNQLKFYISNPTMGGSEETEISEIRRLIVGIRRDPVQSGFILSDAGQITGSQVLFDGGEIGGFELSSTEIKHSGNALRLKGNGEITGSKALFTGGKIGTFTLSSDKLESDATNTKRGLKLEPGKSIRGYGNEAHTTVSRQGGFSFSTGAVVSSATGINPFITTKPPQASGL